MDIATKYKGASIYIGIQHKNSDGSYNSIDDMLNLAVLIYVDPTVKQIIAKKTGAVSPEITMVKESSTLYSFTIPDTITSDLLEGTYTIEVLEKVTDNKGGYWRGISKIKAFELVDSISKDITL